MIKPFDFDEVEYSLEQLNECQSLVDELGKVMAPYRAGKQSKEEAVEAIKHFGFRWGDLGEYAALYAAETLDYGRGYYLREAREAKLRHDQALFKAKLVEAADDKADRIFGESL